MPTTTASSKPLARPTFGRRAGATWVAATGAALVLVAAGVLVASQWDRLSDVFKLGLLASGTGFCAWAGHRLRNSLPATGSVVFHLGLLLVPANLAAIAIHLSASLGQHLLAQGVVGALLFSAAAAATGSVVFKWVSYSSVPLIAAGVGALTPVPALAVLIAFAVIAEWWPRLRFRDAVVPWAAFVGLAPALVAVVQLDTTGDISNRVFATIGLHSTAVTWMTSLAAAGVLAWRAERDRSLPVATLAIVSAALGGVRAGATGHLGFDEALLGIASAFVLIETLTLAVTADRFWHKPLAALAAVVEAPMWIGGMVTAGVVLLTAAVHPSAADFHDTTATAVFFVSAAGWFIADMRRRPISTPFANVAIALSLSLGVLASTGSVVLTGVALAAFSLAFIAIPRAPRFFALGAGPLAAGLAASQASVAIGIGVVVAASLVVEARRNAPDDVMKLYATGAVATGLSGIWFAGIHGLTAALPSVAVVYLVAAAVEDLSSDTADLCRAFFLLPLLMVDGAQRDVTVVTGTLAAVLAVDAMRVRRPVLAGVAALAAQAAVVSGCRASGLTRPDSGVALGFVTLVLTGAATIAEGEWRRPLVNSAVVAAAFSTYLAMGDVQSFAIVAMVLGGLGVAAGISERNDALANAGGVAIAIGAGLQMSLAHVHVVELYLLPVAAHLAVAGEIMRRRRPLSSWLSAAPAPALVGSVAVLERISGGGAEHAAIAAIVAAFAVAIGGNRRQIGPLMAGTGILGCLAVNESLSALAGMPAWGWIGLVGASLIATAVMIERTDTSPVEVGRRLVDVIGDSFE